MSMARRKKDRRQLPLLEKAADIFDLPVDVLADLPKLEISGCRNLLMENHQGILEYGTEEIDIGGGKVIVKVKGQDLELRSMNANALTISGLIFSVEFIF